jgi:hypothetical protein
MDKPFLAVGLPWWVAHGLSLLVTLLFFAAVAAYQVLRDALEVYLLIGHSKFLDLIDDARVVIVNGRPITVGRVKYKLSRPETFQGKRFLILGGGNASVKAALELVTEQRNGRTGFRPPEETNEVTLVLRRGFEPDLRYESYVSVWQCVSGGKIKAFFNAVIKEACEGRAVLKDVDTGEEVTTVEYDFIVNLTGEDCGVV